MPCCRVTERGSHHRVIERTITETLPNGKTVERRSAYTEIATGMHYQNERGEWLESREEIEIIDGNAVARRTQCPSVEPLPMCDCMCWTNVDNWCPQVCRVSCISQA